ncbi:MAG: tRNA uracil 4-sulfurtransferase ThiI [Candidatus Nealsonbacteria bacterium]
MDYIICHYHEIGLKGKNRWFFEERLVKNIKRVLPKDSFDFVKRISGRIIVRVSKKGVRQEKKIKEALKNVFGIVYFAFAHSCEQKIEIIKKKAFEILKTKKFKSFRISTQRSKKEFHLTSPEVNEKVGEFIVKKLKKKVDLKKPGVNLFIEIVEKYVFLYSLKIKGRGGLPLGVSGKAVVLLSGGIDSPVAAFFAMKRGIKVIFVHFHAHPYTDKASIEKTKRIVKVLNKFQFNSKLYLIPFADIQKEILLNTLSKLRVILYRRFMLLISQEIARKERALALVTGESVGQVASQTLENIKAVAEASKIPILRPLICHDKEEIIARAKDIGTFNISILPYQDCCTRFLPRYPETRADLKQVKLAEKKLNCKKLINKALNNAFILLIDEVL